MPHFYSYIATLVERPSRFLMLIKVPSKDTAVVVAALSKYHLPWKAEFIAYGPHPKQAPVRRQATLDYEWDFPPLSPSNV
jgi:hypothetical protein